MLFFKNRTKKQEIPTVAHQENSNTRVCTMRTYQNKQKTVTVTDKEVTFPDGCLITSRTNLEGIITHANDAFITMSGYERSEIIMQPHNILRHPDMPKAAFADMWSKLQNGEKWHGYVKNLRKDGGFYWVFATIIPNIRHGQLVGFTSVRRKPAREKIAEVEQIYREMLAKEQIAEKSA